MLLPLLSIIDCDCDGSLVTACEHVAVPTVPPLYKLFRFRVRISQIVSTLVIHLLLSVAHILHEMLFLGHHRLIALLGIIDALESLFVFLDLDLFQLFLVELGRIAIGAEGALLLSRQA